MTAEAVLRVHAILAGNDPAEDEETLLSDLLADLLQWKTAGDVVFREGAAENGSAAGDEVDCKSGGETPLSQLAR